MELELWRPIQNTKGRYWVSNFGAIATFVRKGGQLTDRLQRILRAHRVGKRREYLQVKLVCNENSRRRYVHCLVAEAFVGPIPEGKQVNHLNGVKTDCAADNLEFASPSQNMEHSYSLGTHRSGPRIGICVNGHVLGAVDQRFRNGRRNGFRCHVCWGYKRKANT